MKYKILVFEVTYRICISLLTPMIAHQPMDKEREIDYWLTLCYYPFIPQSVMLL